MHAAAIAKLKFGKPRDHKPVEVSAPLVFDPASTGGAFASLTGTGDVSSGFDDSNIYGGLLGNEAGEMNGGYGVGGLGVQGGGGGTGWGTIGTGKYGTLGHGSGTTPGVPTLVIPQPVVTGPGELDRGIIRARPIATRKLLYCYERSCSSPPPRGEVSLDFAIQRRLHVPLKASGTKTGAESCVPP